MSQLIFKRAPGDGTNDELEVASSLMRVGTAAPVQVHVFDLSGRLVSGSATSHSKRVAMSSHGPVPISPVPLSLREFI